MNIKKVLKVLLLAVVLEVLWFNRDPLLMRILPGIERDIVYSLDDVALINYTENEFGEAISILDPQVHLPPVDSMVYRMEIGYQTSPAQIGCTVYYTNPDGEVLSRNGLFNRRGFISMDVDAAPGTVLRLDIGELEGIVLTELNVTLNPTALHISMSRIIAVLLIYISGVLLFGLQKMPDYSQYVVPTKEEKKYK